MGFVAILKKELKSYFYSPIAYVVITMFLILNGYFFFGMMLSFAEYGRMALENNPEAKININDGVIRQLFGNMSFVMLLILPVLTMRLFSEEKKSGTFELITTYPIKDIDLVIGKILSATAVLLLMVGLTSFYCVFMYSYSQPDTGRILTGYLGTILMGIAFISMGTFISALTESQIISAIVTFGILLIFWVLGWVGTFSSAEGTIAEVFKQLSMLNHFESFGKGIIDLSDVVYFISFITLSIFLTLRALESKKWRS